MDEDYYRIATNVSPLANYWEIGKRVLMTSVFPKFKVTGY